MTVRELKEILATMNDTDEIVAVKRTTDRDGIPYDMKMKIEAIVKKDAEPIERVCGNPLYY